MSEGLGGTSTVNRHSWNAHGEELYLIIRTITSHIKFRTRNVNHSPTYTLAQSVLLQLHDPNWDMRCMGECIPIRDICIMLEVAGLLTLATP